MKLSHALSTCAVAALMITGATGVPADAASSDRDGDGIPNRWESSHGMDPLRAADARADFDRDGLVNVREYRLGGLIRDEDTDDDGHDDGDEVTDGTRSTSLVDADTDDDGIEDGDEDADRDGIDNEDEDDAEESCRLDDDDRDADNVDDEDENDYGLRIDVADTDANGILDGDEDTDEDGQANEDDDDDAGDRCDGDFDGDGKHDEDDGDLFGTIASFVPATGTLSVNSLAGFTVTSVVDGDTKIELEEPEGFEGGKDGDFEDEGSTADLVAGARVVELELDDKTGAFESVTLYYQP